MVFVLIHLINLLWMDLAIKTCGNGLTYGPCGFFFFLILRFYIILLSKILRLKQEKKNQSKKKKI